MLGTAMRFALILAAFFAATSNVEATDFSIVGTQLGMTDAEILKSLPLDLKNSASRNLIGALGEFPALIVNVTAGAKECGWGRKREYPTPCIAYRALLFQNPPFFRATSVTLDQFFERPVDIATMENRLVKAYGEPSIRIAKPIISFNPKTGAIEEQSKSNLWLDGKPISIRPFSPLPMWIWSSDLLAVSENDRQKLLENIPNPGRIGLATPMLRAYINVDDNGLVRGLSLILHEPIAMGKQDALLDEATDVQRRLRENEAASSIKLK
jgi:hypothetical protein